MGSQIDMLDEISNTISPLISATAQANRLYLKEVMEKQGFDNYRKEWWHFALLNEPFPRKPEDHFDFLVASTLSCSSISRVLIRSGSAHSRPQWPGT